MKKKPFVTMEKLQEITERFPTPFHLYDERGIRENAMALKEAFAWNKGFKEFFAVKATPNPYLIQILQEYGCGCDCSSMTELMLSKAIGCKKGDIMFSSNDTPEAEFRYANEIGGIINLDDITHIEAVEKAVGYIPKTISCRYNPGGLFKISNDIMDNPGDAIYGMTTDQIFEAFRILKAKGAEEFGIHAFLASNTVTNEYYPMLAKIMFELAVKLQKETGAHVGFINLSGGIGIPYRPEQTPNDIRVIGEGVRKVYEEVLVPEGMGEPAVYDGETKLAVQKTADGAYVFFAAGVPGKGYKTYTVKEEAADTTPTMEVSTKVMENEFFKVEYNEKGQFAKIYDKKAERDVLKPGEAGNVIVSYEDRPHNYDAWDVNNYYTEKSWDIDQVSAMEVVENGPVRACVKVERKYLDSTITQFIYLYRDIPRIDIKNVIDWKEHQIFVKDYFPIDVHTNEATFDIQYGNVKRDTHDNTSWDFAKFEVCHHKWMDVSEDGYGVSMLNDCKYGVGVRNGVIGMSMLKSAIHPNPEADKELHEFTYSIYPHQGGWREAGTVKQAYQINNPLTYSWKENEGGTLAPEYSLVSSDKDNAVIEVVKKAEDSDAVIVRLYECYNRRTPVTLIFGKELTSVVECNMMEEGADPVEFTGNQATFEMKPYEIKTLKVTF